MIRPYQHKDLQQLADIAQSAKPYPWAVKNFQNCLDANYPGWVFEQNKKVIGFVITMETPDDLQILNIAVDKDFQGQGLGQQLLEQVIDLAHQQQKKILLEVRASNTNAIAFYMKNRFAKIAVRRDYYPDDQGREDAWVMVFN